MTESFLRLSGTAMLTRDHIVLPATHRFIHWWNKPCHPLLCQSLLLTTQAWICRRAHVHILVQSFNGHFSMILLLDFLCLCTFLQNFVESDECVVIFTTWCNCDHLTSLLYASMVYTVVGCPPICYKPKPQDESSWFFGVEASFHRYNTVL